MVWIFLIWFLFGGMNMTSTEGTTGGGNQAVCTVTTQAPVIWTSSSSNTPLSATSPASDRRQKVEFVTAAGDPRHMEIMYGATTKNSDINLTTRNSPASTPNIQYPDGPGVEIVHGWAFITFQWPLIWMDSIDAGSIGTTSVLRNQETQADVYLISNKLDIANPDTPNTPAACTDPQTKLYVLAKGASGVCVAVPNGFEAVRRRYELERDAQGKVTKVTFVEQKSLHIEKTAAGRIKVADDQFLESVLDCAFLQGLYDIP